MDFIKKYKTIILIIAIIIIGWFGYSILFVEEGEESLLVSDFGVLGSENTASVAENELLTLLLDVRLVELDGSIFSGDVFKSLNDFSQEIIPEPVGRENPFESIEESFIPEIEG